MLEQLPKILEESRKQVERLLNSPLKLKAQVSEVVYPNAKYGALFSSVMREDSALGIHSSDSKDLGTTADFLSSSAPKSLESPTSNTAKPAAVQGEAEAGFFRNLRILEAENRGESEKALSLSLRGGDQAFHTNKTEKVDSSGDSMDCHAANAARNDDKGVDSMIAPPPRISINLQTLSI